MRRLELPLWGCAGANAIGAIAFLVAGFIERAHQLPYNVSGNQ